MNNQYHSHMETTPQIWIAACANQLQRRWRTVDPEQLEELAADLWRVPELRRMAPTVAASALQPVSKPLAA